MKLTALLLFLAGSMALVNAADNVSSFNQAAAANARFFLVACSDQAMMSRGLNVMTLVIASVLFITTMI